MLILFTDQDLGDVDTGGYLTGIRKYVPDPLVSLIDDITIETVFTVPFQMFELIIAHAS